MKSYHSEGIICIKDRYGIEYRVCHLAYTLNEDETFEYVFTPNYSVIDLTDASFFQGIPGLNLDLRRKQYVRSNMVPCFISERVPQPNRVDYYELLEEVGMTYMDPLLYLIRTDKVYFGDRFYVIPIEAKKTVDFDSSSRRLNSISCIRLILSSLAAGDDLLLGEYKIDDSTRMPVFRVVHSLYVRSVAAWKAAQEEGVAQARSSGKYHGRKPVPFDTVKFHLLLGRVERKEMSVKQAAGELGISTDKFYREKRKLEKGK